MERSVICRVKYSRTIVNHAESFVWIFCLNPGQNLTVKCKFSSSRDSFESKPVSLGLLGLNPQLFWVVCWLLLLWSPIPARRNISVLIFEEGCNSLAKNICPCWFAKRRKPNVLNKSHLWAIHWFFSLHWPLAGTTSVFTYMILILSCFYCMLVDCIHVNIFLWKEAWQSDRLTK